MNRAQLQLVVGVESIVLLALVVLALRSPSGETPAEAPPVVAVQQTEPAPAEASRPAGSGPAALAPAGLRTEAAGATGAPGADTLLFGAVKSADGSALEECMVHVWRPGSPPSQRTLQLREGEGHYAFAGLASGTWELQVRTAGFREHRATLELSGHPARLRRDVVLERALLVKVKFVTPEGTPLQDVKDLFGPTARFGFPIVAVATRRQPTGNLPMTENRDWSGLGLAEWQANDPIGASGGRPLTLPRPWVGQLDLREPPPCFVSAVYRHLVLGTQALAPGQTELSFTIDPERVKGCVAAAKVRVVDARTKAGVAGARVALSDRQTGSQGTLADAQGEVLLTGLAPGLLALSASAPGYAGASQYVRLTPGQTQDLGTLELSPPVKLTGTVTDREGKPLTAAEVTCLRLDQRAFPQPTDLTQRATTKEDGTFECATLAPGSYLVRARVVGLAATTARVDLRSGEVPPLRMVAEAGVEVTLDFQYERDESYLVQAMDASGALLWAARWVGGRTSSLRMLPGSYALELLDDQQLVRRIPVRVGATALRVAVKP